MIFTHPVGVEMSFPMIRLTVSDLQQVVRRRGLHAELLLKHEGDRAHARLVGIASFSPEMEIDAILIVENDLVLGVDVATALVRVAINSCWNDVVIEGRAAVGTEWRPLVPWLTHYFKPEGCRR
jgi:hypothetical protein